MVVEEYPDKCNQCAKLERTSIHKECDFCIKLGFKEEIICDLIRLGQKGAEFGCNSFEPCIKLLNSRARKNSNFNYISHSSLQEYSIDDVLKSYEFNSERQKALEKLNIDSDDCVYCDIRFHYVISVIHRKSIFNPGNDFYLIYDSFLKCSKLVDGFACLLWLAPDHVHVYVESDGEKSPDTIFKELKRVSSNSILVENAYKYKELEDIQEIWVDEYFVETVTASS